MFLPFGGRNCPARSAHFRHSLSFLFCTLLIAFLSFNIGRRGNYVPPLSVSYLATFIQTRTIGSLSKDVFERRTSTGSEAFSLFICLDTTKFVLLSFFSPIKTIYLRVSTKPQPNAAKSPLPVDVRRPKTLLLKLPNTIKIPT